MWDITGHARIFVPKLALFLLESSLSPKSSLYDMSSLNQHAPEYHQVRQAELPDTEPGHPHKSYGGSKAPNALSHV